VSGHEERGAAAAWKTARGGAPKAASRRGRAWTPTENGVVLTEPPAVAARLLGRSLQAVYVRRSKLAREAS
jgi:hypothetical protein